MTDNMLPTSNGDALGKTYSALTHSGFFTWFNLSQSAKDKNLFGLWAISLEPGAYQEHIHITVTIDDQDQVLSAALQLNRDWIRVGKGLNPMALDITQSFISAMVLASETAEV